MIFFLELPPLVLNTHLFSFTTFTVRNNSLYRYSESMIFFWNFHRSFQIPIFFLQLPPFVSNTHFFSFTTSSIRNNSLYLYSEPMIFFIFDSPFRLRDYFFFLDFH